jgi:hypothetical protein
MEKETAILKEKPMVEWLEQLRDDYWVELKDA